jgi:hypothetical protein
MLCHARAVSCQRPEVTDLGTCSLAAVREPNKRTVHGCYLLGAWCLLISVVRHTWALRSCSCPLSVATRQNACGHPGCRLMYASCGGDRGWRAASAPYPCCTVLGCPVTVLPGSLTTIRDTRVWPALQPHVTYHILSTLKSLVQGCRMVS